jgi:transposase
MANLDQLKEQSFRQNRYFSEDFRRKKVNEIDKCITSIADICREYQVSRGAVYKWIYKYSLMKKKGVKTVVESESDTKAIKALKDHISQLEQLLGQKQFEIDFLNKQIEIASDKYGIDVKKKLSGKDSSGFGKTGNNIDTK